MLARPTHPMPPHYAHLSLLSHLSSAVAWGAPLAAAELSADRKLGILPDADVEPQPSLFAAYARGGAHEAAHHRAPLQQLHRACAVRGRQRDRDCRAAAPCAVQAPDSALGCKCSTCGHARGAHARRVE